MRTSINVLIGLALTLFALQTYAIQISVQTSSPGVAALGFTVNGQSHGGAGKSYSKSGLPAGSYSFGIRVGGVFGTDVGCSTGKGQKFVNLNSDTTAILNYDGRRCIIRLMRQ